VGDDENNVLSTSIHNPPGVDMSDQPGDEALWERATNEAIANLRDETQNAGVDLLASIPERVFGGDDENLPTYVMDANGNLKQSMTPEELEAIIEGDPVYVTDGEGSATPVAEPKPQLVLDADQQLMAARWLTYLGQNPATPVEEHEMLTAASDDVVLRDYLVVSLLFGWLGDEIDGGTDTNDRVTAAAALEETLGRCANDSPEKSACQAMLFTAHLAEQLGHNGHDYMKALQWMTEEDVQMLVEASGHASPEMSTYIVTLLQSVAVTKVAS